MSNRLGKGLIGSAAVVVLVIGAHLPATAQVLPLVVESTSTEIGYWWSEPATPELSPFEQALVLVSDVDFVDPRLAEAGEHVSRFYQNAHLSDTSVRNLAELYDAEWVLLGTVDVLLDGAVAGDMFSVVRCSIDLRLLPVRVEFSHSLDPVECFARGADASSAMEEATGLAAEQIAEQVRGWLGDSSIGTTVSGSPTLILQGLDRATPLVAFKGDLRSYREIILDVREAWATEGTIGLELDLQPGHQFQEVIQIIEELAVDPERTYVPVIDDRQDQMIWVVLGQRQQLEPVEYEGENSDSLLRPEP